MKHESEFSEWLVGEKGYSKRAAGNVLSRCRRIELILKKEIHLLTKNTQQTDLALAALKKEADRYLAVGSNKVTAVGALRTALRLYARFSGE